LLVLDAYAGEGREALRRVGATEAGELYRRMLARLAPDAEIDVAYPADSDACLPPGRALGDYAGVAWTGSSLSIGNADDAPVRRQVELARAQLAAGVPGFGSCWAIQLVTVAAGGSCGACAQGREFGISRQIRLSERGAGHPLYAGKPLCFDALASHADEVAKLPDRAELLASNDWSDVQALAIEGSAAFWAVQYHPEYDLHEVASLCALRADELVAQGSFPDRAAAARFSDALEALHADPGRADLIRELDLDASVLDPDLRTLEVRNWLAHAVRRDG
jgi:GMP synthase (glutamine-hydrolysing)